MSKEVVDIDRSPCTEYNWKLECRVVRNWEHLEKVHVHRLLLQIVCLRCPLAVNTSAH